MKEELLTGKNKEEFEKWCNQNKKLWNHTRIEEKISDWVLNSPFEMQLGVLLSYYKSKRMYILVQPFETPNDWIYQILGEDIMSPFFVMSESDIDDPEESQEESYKEAFIKANELMNKELEK